MDGATMTATPPSTTATAATSDGSSSSNSTTTTTTNNNVIRVLAESGRCTRLFVAGDKTHCGKTTVALGILGALLREGVPASRLGYIKPATQCEAPDLLAAWGVSHVEGTNAPLVFFKGFTRSFLEGHQCTSADWIAAIAAAVDAAAAGKAFLVVDGVGFPAVGSVVGVSNVEVAAASRAPVVVVGKSGVGGAIDAYS